MKKICIVAGHVRYHTGGAEVQAIRIATELRQKGYDVCFLNNPIRNTRDFPEIEVVDGIEIYNYRCCKRLRLFDFFRIKRLVEKIDADTYYMRASPFNEGFVTYLTRRKGINSVWQCASGRSMVKYYRTKELLASWRPLTILANVFNHLTEDILRLYAIRRARWVVSQSEAIRSTLGQRFNRDSQLVLKGIRIEAEAVEKDRNSLNVLFLRTIRGYSRHELFLEVAKQFKGNHDIKFSIAGRLAKSTRSLLNSLPDYDVEYLGFLPNDEALATLAQSHILIDTLEEPEGLTAYNTSFLEAWSKKVVVLSFGSNPDNVFERCNVGYKVNSVDDCVEKIRYLAHHRDVLDNLGQDAYQYVLQQHNIDNETNELIAVLD